MDNSVRSISAGNHLVLPDVSPVPVRLERANTLSNRVREYIEVEKGHWVQRGKFSLATETRKLELFFAGKEFNRENIMKFCLWMRTNLTPSGYHRCSSINRAFIRWMHRMQYISSPLHEFMPRVPAPPPGEIVIVTDEQYRRFVEEYRSSPYGWAMVLAYHTAFRLGDVCSLRWSEVDLKTQWIRKIPNKTRRNGEKVEVPILSGSDLYEWLDRLSKDKDDPEFVSPELWRRYQSHYGLPSDLSKALRSVGIYTTFHSLRKTFESRLANSGMNLAVAAKITGRRDPKSLMRYVKPDPEVVRQGVTMALQSGNDPMLINQPILPKSKDPTPMEPEDLVPTTEQLPAEWLV